MNLGPEWHQTAGLFLSCVVKCWLGRLHSCLLSFTLSSSRCLLFWQSCLSSPHWFHLAHSLCLVFVSHTSLSRPLVSQHCCQARCVSLCLTVHPQHLSFCLCSSSLAVHCILSWDACYVFHLLYSFRQRRSLVDAAFLATANKDPHFTPVCLSLLAGQINSLLL